MSTEIIFVRHGETDMNKEGLYFGHLDPSLNGTGIVQLTKCGNILKEIERKINRVFCSPLKRCRESLELLEINEDIKIDYVDDFKEINFGVLEGKTYYEITKEFPEFVDEMNKNWRIFKAKNGESLEEVQKRAVKKTEEIFEKYKNQKILVVAHSGVIKSILSYYLYENLDGFWKLKVDNGSISKIVRLDDGFTLVDYINRI